MTVGRVTQEVIESLVTNDPTARITQEVVESLVANDPTARITQEVLEVLVSNDPTGRVTQNVVEAVVSNNPTGRVTQNVVEVVTNFAVPITSEGTTFLNAQDKSASTIWNSATTNTDINSGQFGIIILVTDNEDNSDGVSTLHTTVSVGGNSLIKAREYTASQSAPNAGSTVSVWYFKASSLISSGAVVTVTLNTGRTAKAITGHVFDIDSPYEIAFVDGVNDESITASTPGSLTATGTKSLWHYWVRAIGMEWPTDTLGTLTRTSDAWLGMTENGSTGNPDASNQSVRVEYKIGFGPSSGVSDPDLAQSADGASTLVGLALNIVRAGDVAETLPSLAQSAAGTVSGSGGGPPPSPADIHFARVGVFNIDAVGNVLNKNSPNISIQQQLQTSIDHRMIIDSSISNTANNPTVKAYLELEASDDFVVERINQSTIVTYLRDSSGGYPEP